MSSRWIEITVLLLALIDRPSRAQPQLNANAPAAATSASQYDTYQAGVALFRQERYREAAVAFERAYAQNPLPGLLRNLGTAYRRMAQLAQGEAARDLARKSVALFDRYLSEEPGNIACDALRQRAEAERIASGGAGARVHDAVAMLESESAVRAAHLRSGNPSLLYCIAHAQLGYARELDSVELRRQYAARALESYRAYRGQLAAHRRIAEPLSLNEEREAQALSQPTETHVAVEKPLHRRTGFRVLMGGLGLTVAACVITGAVLGSRGSPRTRPADWVEIPAATPWLPAAVH